MSNVLYADMNPTDGFGDTGTKLEGPVHRYGFVIYMQRTGDKINDPFSKYTLVEIEEFVRTLPLLSDLYYLRRTRKEKRQIAMLTAVHWDGVVRKQHQSSQDR